jgi:anti-sigma factor RsiW
VSGTPAPRGGDHEAFDELAVGWALHALEPEDEAVFARHLPDCTRCAHTVAETVEVMSALAGDLPPAEPSEELRQRLRAAVEETEQIQRPLLPVDQPERRAPEVPDPPARVERRAVPPPPPAAVPRAAGEWPPRAPRPGWRSRTPQLLLAAAVAVLVALGIWDVSLSTSRQQAQEVSAEQAHILDALMAPGQATIAPVSDHAGHAVATVVARHGQVQVVTWGLDMNNRQATTYVVWGMQTGSPVPLGTFDVVSTSLDLRTLGSDKTGLDAYSGYAISIEPGRAAPPSPSQIVANGQVTS